MAGSAVTYPLGNLRGLNHLISLGLQATDFKPASGQTISDTHINEKKVSMGGDWNSTIKVAQTFTYVKLDSDNKVKTKIQITYPANTRVRFIASTGVIIFLHNNTTDPAWTITDVTTGGRRRRTVHKKKHRRHRSTKRN
jgi:hypothetical protein